MDVLKFLVLDEEDLEVASTHLQDAVVKVSDVHWRPGEKRLVVALNRFDWESAGETNNVNKISAPQGGPAFRAGFVMQVPAR